MTLVLESAILEKCRYGQASVIGHTQREGKMIR